MLFLEEKGEKRKLEAIREFIRRNNLSLRFGSFETFQTFRIFQHFAGY